MASAVKKNFKKITFGNRRKSLLLCTYTLIFLAKFCSKKPLTILKFGVLCIAQSRKGIFNEKTQQVEQSQPSKASWPQSRLLNGRKESENLSVKF